MSPARGAPARSPAAPRPRGPESRRPPGTGARRRPPPAGAPGRRRRAHQRPHTRTIRWKLPTLTAQPAGIRRSTPSARKAPTRGHRPPRAPGSPLGSLYERIVLVQNGSDSGSVGACSPATDPARLGSAVAQRVFTARKRLKLTCMKKRCQGLSGRLERAGDGTSGAIPPKPTSPAHQGRQDVQQDLGVPHGTGVDSRCAPLPVGHVDLQPLALVQQSVPDVLAHPSSIWNS